jgi:hypothetical protein
MEWIDATPASWNRNRLSHGERWWCGVGFNASVAPFQKPRFRFFRLDLDLDLDLETLALPSVASAKRDEPLLGNMGDRHASDGAESWDGRGWVHWVALPSG